MANTLKPKDILESTTPIMGEFILDCSGEDLDFGECKFLEHNFTVKDSQNLGKLTFNGFRGFIEFEECHIREIVLDEEVDSIAERKAPFKIEKCGIEGVRIKSRIDGNLEMKGCRFTGITDFSNSKIERLNLSESNFDYTRIIDAEIGELNLETCRFVQLFDLTGTKVGSINMSKAIILETFVLPEIDRADLGECLDFTDLSINGKVSLTMPIGKVFENKFIQSFDKSSSSSEFLALRQIFESNRRYSAADTAYIYQK